MTNSVERARAGMVESIASGTGRPAKESVAVDVEPVSMESCTSGIRFFHSSYAGAFLCLLAGVVFALMAGCGNFFATSTSTTTTTGTGTGTTSTTDHLYVANNNANLNTIAGFTVSSGTLTATTSSPYAFNGTPTALALTPSNGLLYVATQVSGIFVFTVNSDGSLSVGNGGTAVAAITAQAIAIDPSGNYLLAMQNQGANQPPVVSVYTINATDGTLTGGGTSNTLALDGGAAEQLLFIPSTTSTHLLYAALGTYGLDVLTFNSSTGQLDKLTLHYNPLGNAYSDVSLATNPAGTFLFMAETAAGGVRSFTINADGSLTALATPLTPVGTGVSAVLVDATGAYLYVATVADSNSPSVANTISAFSISSTGALTAVSGSPFITGSGPVAMVEDNTKGYIAVVCEGGTPDLQVFPFSTSVQGALGTPLKASTGSTNPAGAYAVAASH